MKHECMGSAHYMDTVAQPAAAHAGRKLAHLLAVRVLAARGCLLLDLGQDGLAIAALRL